MYETTYDVIVIGAGSGGLNIAGFMNRAGFRVLLIDKTDANIGGDCLNFGCVPSKALIRVARLTAAMKEGQRFGLQTKGQVKLDRVMEYVREKQEIIRAHENAKYFRKIGMDVVLGPARFTGPRRVNVNGTDYTAKRILLATGSRPRELNVPGIDRATIETNETIFNRKALPKRLLVIGGGPIGAELGQAFAQLGSEVTMLIRGESFLPKEDPEIARVLLRQLERDGVEVLFNAEVKEFGSKTTATISRSGKEEQRTFDVVLVSIGRQLNIDGLGLEEAGIMRDASGGKLVVDEYLRTTNPYVFVCGDVAGSYQFTHAAELHASVILGNWFKPRVFWRKVSYETLAWVTYTTPEIATWGLTEPQLAGRSYERIEMDFAEDDRAIIDERTEGKLLLFVAKGRLLGGSMIGANAGELAQELMLATSAKLPLQALFDKIYPYPTATRVTKRAVSVEYAKRLTPFVKRVLRMLY